MTRFLVRSLMRAVALCAGALCLASAQAEDIKLGLVAALTGQSAQSGEAITRGLTLAIDEINAQGGVLGRKLEMIVADEGEAATEGPKVGIAATPPSATSRCRTQCAKAPIRIRPTCSSAIASVRSTSPTTPITGRAVTARTRRTCGRPGSPDFNRV